MKNYKFFWNFLLIISYIFIFIAPDFLSKIFTNSNKVFFSVDFFIIVTIFSFLLSFSGKIFIYFILSIFLLMELSQFLHLFHFGSFISPFTIKNIFFEIREIINAGFSRVENIIYTVLILIIPYVTTYILTNYADKKRFHIKYFFVIPCILLLLAPYKIYNSSFLISYPDPTAHSLRNSLYSYSAFFTKILPNIIYNSNSTEQFIPYKIENISSNNNRNIILVIGESYNDKHLSLLGYERNTQPMLEKFKNNKNFIIKNSISSAVVTQIALPLILNSVREPGNMDQVFLKNANLFKLAKQNNFHTHFISAQQGNVTREIGTEYIDNIVVREDMVEFFNKNYDFGLVKLLKDIDLTKPNFIVLHQRNMHEPYETNYPPNSEFDKYPTKNLSRPEYIINSYDNAVLYNDYIHSEIINYIAQESNLPYEIFITSDHGERTGKNNEFGHVELALSTAEIPFLYYSNFNNKLIELIKANDNINHFEISSYIIDSLGYKLINPNYKKNIYFIHGNNLNYDNDFIEIQKDIQNRISASKIKTTFGMK